MDGIKLKVICAIFIFIIQCAHGADDDLIVDTNVGQIRGLRASDGDYRMFMGIPYGSVNEANPFGPASPFPNFNEVFDAYDDSAICPQIEEFNATIAGTLDCLHINVYVPDTNSTEPLPVLVWIYGGSFEIGFSGRYLYGPSFFVRHDVILVTLNYRVGPYGFMCLDTPEVPGNQGLKDQLLALKWVKNNIGAFGGDDDKITVMGESAGGMSIDFLLLSEHEKLYDKAILQSGTTFTLNFVEPDREAPITIAKHLNYETDDNNDAIAHLATVNPHTIISAVNELKIQFRPCLEKELDDVESFISVDWVRAEKQPNVENMPLLVGFTDEEWLVRYVFQDAEFFRTSNLVEDTLRSIFEVDHEDFSGMVEVMRHFYFGDAPYDESMKWQMVDFDSDLTFVYPTHRSIKRYLDSDAGNIYLYKFAYVGERNFVKQKANITVGGAGHADEIGYLFDISYMPQSNPVDQLIVDRMTTMWTNFVKYGDPTPQITELLPRKWQPITNGSQYHYLNIDTDFNVGTRPFNDRMAFLDLFYTANHELQRVYPESEDDEDDGNAANYRSLSYLLVMLPILMILVN